MPSRQAATPSSTSASIPDCSAFSFWMRPRRSAGRASGDWKRPLLEMMEMGISRAAEAGRIGRRPPGPLAHFLFGALCEMAMIVARADDQKAAHRQASGRSAASWMAWPSADFRGGSP